LLLKGCCLRTTAVKNIDILLCIDNEIFETVPILIFYQYHLHHLRQGIDTHPPPITHLNWPTACIANNFSQVAVSGIKPYLKQLASTKLIFFVFFFVCGLLVLKG